MTQWLLQQIRVHEPERSPEFALRSSINWMAALSHEVSEEHGQTVQAQKASLQQAFGNVARRQSVARLDLVFEPLFASLNFATALVTAARRPASEPWESPSLIVTWYYAAYNAVRSMLAALGQPPADKHAKVIAMVGPQARWDDARAPEVPGAQAPEHDRGLLRPLHVGRRCRVGREQDLWGEVGAARASERKKAAGIGRLRSLLRRDLVE